MVNVLWIELDLDDFSDIHARRRGQMLNRKSPISLHQLDQSAQYASGDEFLVNRFFFATVRGFVAACCRVQRNTRTNLEVLAGPNSLLKPLFVELKFHCLIALLHESRRLELGHLKVTQRVWMIRGI